MREDKQLYQRAAEKAWAELDARLKDLSAGAPGKRLELVQISYDPLPGESIIEELPEQAKSSRPETVRVSVLLRATYILH